MLRWLGKAGIGDHDRPESDGASASQQEQQPQTDEVVTDDPLAVIGLPGSETSPRQIYSVSRSVVLPRVALRTGGGINPIFIDNHNCTTLSHKPPQLKHPPCDVSPVPADNPSSSGYGSHGGSSHDPLYADNMRLREDAVAILEQNANFVKSILVAVKNSKKSRKSVGSLGSSGGGTLSTIPEGKVDFAIPRPVWPQKEEPVEKKMENTYDSIVDDTLLLYTSLSYVPEKEELSAKDILKDLSDTINAAIEGKVNLSPEEILKKLNERLSLGLDLLHQNNDDISEDIRKFYLNLSNSEQLTAFVRAFSNSSSGNSSQSSPEWSRNRTSSADNDEIYLPSSSSGFSDKVIYENAQLPVFVHEDLCSVPNGVRNAMIYGTLCRAGTQKGSANERLLGKEDKVAPVKGSLLASPDAKPSVWELYYRAGMDEDLKAKNKNGDSPYFPTGRPEADFTLDVPRSEILMRKMKAAKKWRFRCRLVTSLLGLVFFLLSLMAVSLMLTRGKRMFGSMV